jgi:sulfur-oxidizing protein SoxY
MHTRRQTLVLTAALGAAALLPPGRAQARAAEDAIAAFTGGAVPLPGGITLEAPERAENGASVLVGVEAPGAVEILLMAPANPIPVAGHFRFGPRAVAGRVSARIRLSETQEVLALARMADGTIREGRRAVAVDIGACIP